MDKIVVVNKARRVTRVVHTRIVSDAYIYNYPGIDHLGICSRPYVTACAASESGGKV